MLPSLYIVGNIITNIVGVGILAFLQASDVEPGNHGEMCSYSIVMSGKIGKTSDCFRVKANLTTINYSRVLCVSLFPHSAALSNPAWRRNSLPTQSYTWQSPTNGTKSGFMAPEKRSIWKSNRWYGCHHVGCRTLGTSRVAAAEQSGVCYWRKQVSARLLERNSFGRSLTLCLQHQYTDTETF